MKSQKYDPNAINILVDPPSPGSPEADQRQFVKEWAGVDNRHVQDEVRRVRQNIRDRTWEAILGPALRPPSLHPPRKAS